MLASVRQQLMLWLKLNMLANDDNDNQLCCFTLKYGPDDPPGFSSPSSFQLLISR